MHETFPLAIVILAASASGCLQGPCPSGYACDGALEVPGLTDSVSYSVRLGDDLLQVQGVGTTTLDDGHGRERSVLRLEERWRGTTTLVHLDAETLAPVHWSAATPSGTSEVWVQEDGAWLFHGLATTHRAYLLGLLFAGASLPLGQSGVLTVWGDLLPYTALVEDGRPCVDLRIDQSRGTTLEPLERTARLCYVADAPLPHHVGGDVGDLNGWVRAGGAEAEAAGPTRTASMWRGSGTARWTSPGTAFEVDAFPSRLADARDAATATDAYRRFAAQHPSVFLASATYLPPADGAQPEWLLQFAAVDGVRPYDVAVAHHDARVSALGLLGQHQVRQEGELAQAPSIVVPLQDLSLRPSVDLSALALEAMDRAGEEAEYAFSVSGSLEAVGGPEAFRLTVHDHGPSGASRVTVYSGVTGQVLSRSDVCELCGDDA